jgi:hypothetical protein
MWGASVYVWRVHKIDYTKLLTLDTTEDKCFLPAADLEKQGETSITLEKAPESGIFSAAVDLSVGLLFTLAIFTQQSRLNLQYKIELARDPVVSLAPPNEGSGSPEAAQSYQYCEVFPVLFTVWFVYKMVTPWSKRRHYFTMLYNVCTAPFQPVFFIDSYVGDILTSLVKVLVRTATLSIFIVIYSILWLVSNRGSASGPVLDRVAVHQAILESPLYQYGVVPFFTLLPLWLRLVQCLRRANETSKRFPHFCNGLKYTSAFSVIAFATFQPECKSSGVWVLCFVGATIFQYSWDVTMDWGLVESVDQGGNGRASECASGITALLSNFRIRSELLLRPIGLYPLIMIVNLILRFSWTLTLIPDGRYAGSLNSKPLLHVLFVYLAPIMAAVEIIRRMIWGFIRVEWEHIAVKNSELTKSAPELELLVSEGNTDVDVEVPVDKLEKMPVNSDTDDQGGGFFSSFASATSQISLPYVAQHALTRLVVQNDFVSSFVVFSSNSSIFVESYLFGGSVLIILLIAAWPTII